MMRATAVTRIFFILLGAVTIAGWVFADDATAPAQGRVSYADQSGLIKGKDDSDWSYASVNSLVMPGDTVWADEKSALEMEFPNGVYVRLADGSKLDVMEVPPSALFKGTTGSFYVQRTRRSDGDVTFDTPIGAITVAPDSQIRVDILDEGATTITVRWGNATIHPQGGGEETALKAGERSFVDPGYLPSKAVDFDRSQEDAFDTWNRSRARDVAEGSVPTPIQTNYQGGQAPLGVNDLSGNGEWVTVDEQPYWHPYASEYVPYRYGYWSYVPVQGYVWCDYYPWAYVTTHYGHWRYTPRYGWCWGYYGAYSPAYAYTLHYGDSFVWAPIDIYGYPVCYSGYDAFLLGGINFNYGFSSCAYDYDVFGGFGSVFVVNFNFIFDSHHHHRFNNCDYWNIHSGHDGHHWNSTRPHWTGEQRPYTPSHFYRGATVAGDGRTRAGDRVAQLAGNRQSTGPVGRPTNQQSLRTAQVNGTTPVSPGVRRADLRSVQLANPAGRTRLASAPGPVRAGAVEPPSQTFATQEARRSASLNRGAVASRPTNLGDRGGAAGSSREEQTNPAAGGGRGRIGAPASQTPPSTAVGRPGSVPNPAPTSPGTRPQMTRPSPAVGRPGSVPDATPTSPGTRPQMTRPAPSQGDGTFERPRPQTTRGAAPNSQFGQTRQQSTRSSVAEGPRPQVVRPSAPQGSFDAPRQQYTRPSYSESPRPQVVRPSAPEPRFEAPRQQYGRPEMPQQYARPEAPQQQYSRPEPPQQFSRPQMPQQAPAPHYAPQAPAPQPQYSAPAPTPSGGGRSFSAPSAPSGGQSDGRNFGRGR